MSRSLFILIAALLAGVTIAGASYYTTKCVCARAATRADGDLGWLRSEFHLDDAQMERIRQLHEGYLPKCQSICEKIAEKKSELQEVLDSGKGVTPQTEEKLAEVAALRAQCQAQMLRHFQEVSRAMPPEQGRQYLAKMEQLTLGFHERFEHSMSSETSSPHGHH